MTMRTPEKELPFSSRYSLPLRVSDGLGEVSWETVTQMSSDFQIKTGEKRDRVHGVMRELQMTRLLLMDRIKHCSQDDGKIDPQILIDVVRLLQRCEKVSEEYDVDLKEFSSFLYLISEKLKKEKLARHSSPSGVSGMAPIKEELDSYKSRSENTKKNGKRRRK
ncbi:MAG: hypothetical protein WCT52_05875 [Candidatus Micrarchaeia archaeon]